MNTIFDRTIYTEKVKSQYSMLSSITNELDEKFSNVLIRKNTQTVSSENYMPGAPDGLFDDVDTFVITAVTEEENIIEYTSPVNIVDLNVKDGGYF